MFNCQNKKRSSYSTVDLARFEEALADYWDKSRSLESFAINDLEKHLWLANGAAATAAIGFIQVQNPVPWWQYLGAWVFVSGILALVVMKYISALISSRDRRRFQNAKSQFDADEVTDHVFRDLRDWKFKALKSIYLLLQWGAGTAFIVGSIFTLIGVGHAM